jgi:molybdenum cofactor cytidylyltransferase
MRVEGLILAAGLSSRAPGFKMTLPLNEHTILDNAIRGMLPFCERIVVVGGHRHDELKPICNKYTKVELVLNAKYKEGMFSSVKCGMAALTCERFFMMPGDYPLIRPETYALLLEQKGDVVIPSFNGRAGHPILIDGKCIDLCAGSSEFSDMRGFIKTREVTYVDVDDQGVLLDIDTPEDYEMIKRRVRSENN